MRRRDFLKASTAGAAVLLLPALGCEPAARRPSLISTRAGHLYFAPGQRVFGLRTWDHRIDVLAADGRLEARLGGFGTAPGKLNAPAAMALAPDGLIYVADRGNHRVQVFEPSGRFVHAFGTWGSADGELNYPAGLAFDPAGRLLVSDTLNHRLQVFSPDGRPLGCFGGESLASQGLQAPQAIAVAGDGTVHAVDCGRGLVQVFDAGGRPVRTYGEDGGLFRPRSVALDAEGAAFVADPTTAGVALFSPRGRFLERLPLTVDGRPMAAEHLSFQPDGDLSVTAVAAG